MTKDIREYVKSCPACQRIKIMRYTTAPMKSIKANGPGEIISADIVGPINHKTKLGNQFILSINYLY